MTFSQKLLYVVIAVFAGTSDFVAIHVLHRRRLKLRNFFLRSGRFSLFLFVAVIGTPALSEIGICPISADFVTESDTRETIQHIGTIAVTNTTRRAFVDGAMVQIECAGISPDQLFPGQDDATILANYVRFWSVEPTGPAYREGGRFVIEGTKDIQGIEVTYTYRLFRFANSFAMVATGVPGGGQPADVQRFLTSIELASTSPDPFTAAELAEGRRNHIASCLPAVRADNEARDLGLSEVEVTYFCSCTGQRYFAEFTRLELQALVMGDDASLEQRRLGIQTGCLEEAIK